MNPGRQAQTSPKSRIRRRARRHDPPRHEIMLWPCRPPRTGISVRLWIGVPSCVSSLPPLSSRMRNERPPDVTPRTRRQFVLLYAPPDDRFACPGRCHRFAYRRRRPCSPSPRRGVRPLALEHRVPRSFRQYDPPCVPACRCISICLRVALARPFVSCHPNRLLTTHALVRLHPKPAAT